MWTCPKCDRVFERKGQMHSCKKMPIEQHFNNKDLARGLFDALLKEVNDSIGRCKIISLPCCIHLFGTYDFLAALPKKDSLEIRFSLDRAVSDPKITQSVPLSKSLYKNCIELTSIGQIDAKLLGWLNESYYQKR